MTKYKEVQLHSLRDKIQAEARKREQLEVARKQTALDIKKRKKAIEDVFYLILTLITTGVAAIAAIAFIVYFQ